MAVNSQDPFNLAGINDFATKNVLLQGAANRIDQTIPGGSLAFSGPGRSTSKITLDPAIQRLFDARVTAAGTGATAAGNILGDLEGGRSAVEKATFDRLWGVADPAYQTIDERRRRELLNRGILEGDEAFNKAIRLDVTDPRNRAIESARLDAVRAGGEEMARLANVSSGLLGLDPTKGIPGTSSFFAPTAIDTLGPEQLQTQRNMAANNASLAADQIDAQIKSGNLQALTSLGSAAVIGLLQNPASGKKLASTIATGAAKLGTSVAGYMTQLFGGNAAEAQAVLSDTTSVQALVQSAALATDPQGFGTALYGPEAVPTGDTAMPGEVFRSEYQAAVRDALELGVPKATIETLGPELGTEVYLAELADLGYESGDSGGGLGPAVVGGTASALAAKAVAKAVAPVAAKAVAPVATKAVAPVATTTAAKAATAPAPAAGSLTRFFTARPAAGLAIPLILPAMMAAFGKKGLFSPDAEQSTRSDAFTELDRIQGNLALAPELGITIPADMRAGINASLLTDTEDDLVGVGTASQRAEQYFNDQLKEKYGTIDPHRALQIKRERDTLADLNRAAAQGNAKAAMLVEASQAAQDREAEARQQAQADIEALEAQGNERAAAAARGEEARRQSMSQADDMIRQIGLTPLEISTYAPTGGQFMAELADKIYRAAMGGDRTAPAKMIQQLREEMEGQGE